MNWDYPYLKSEILIWNFNDMTAEEKYKEHLQWFLDRIGKRVWRTNACNCASCKRIYAEGLTIENRDHAIYLRDIEAEFGQGRRYFNTEEERDTYERDTLQNSTKTQD